MKNENTLKYIRVSFYTILWVFILFSLLNIYMIYNAVVMHKGLFAVQTITVILLAVSAYYYYKYRFRTLSKQLNVATQRYDSIMMALEDILMYTITDAKGNIMYASKNFCKTLKYSEDELVGKNHKILKSGEHSEDYYRNLWNRISQGQAWVGEVKNKSKDGQYHWFETVIIPLFKNEEIRQFMAIRIPIDSRKQMEEQRREHTVMLEELLDKIAHKLKAPIATCMGLTQLMEYEKPDEYGVIEKAIEHRKRCAEDLYNFSTEISEDIFKYTEPKTHDVDH